MSKINIDEFFQKPDFYSFLEDILDEENLEPTSIGIIKMVIAGREDELTDKQKNILSKYVIEPNYIQSCKRCSGEIPLCEMTGARYNGGYCSWCNHKIEKGE